MFGEAVAKAQGFPLSATDIAVAYDGFQVLKGVSIDVGPGEIVGLIGPNGAGKTTLFDCLSGFVAVRGAGVGRRHRGHRHAAAPPGRAPDSAAASRTPASITPSPCSTRSASPPSCACAPPAWSSP